MGPGKRKRMRRILREDEKAVIIPMDHGVTLGPVRGLVDMQAIVSKVAEGGADAVVLHRGIGRCVDTRRMGLVTHLSASTRLGPDPNWKVRVCSVEEALMIGSDGVSVHINVGAQREPEMLAKLGDIADDCDAWGIPLLAMMYPRGPTVKSEHDPEAVAHAARLGSELGADIIKTNYTGSINTFREVVRSCPVPVIIAGGPKTETVLGFLKMVSDSVEAGGSGVSIGRNVFQHENPSAMTRALVAVVHEGLAPEEAEKLLAP